MSDGYVPSRCVWDGMESVELSGAEVRRLVEEAARRKLPEGSTLVVGAVKEIWQGIHPPFDPSTVRVVFVEPEFKDDPILKR